MEASFGYPYADSEVLSLFGRYCHRIKSLTLQSNGSEDYDFFRIFGHKLEELDIRGNEEHIKYCLYFCPNIRKIAVFEDSILFTQEKNFCQNLKQLFIL